MDHKERFYATVARQSVDRPASWLGLPDPKAVPNLLKYFGAKYINEVRTIIDDDLYPVSLPYHSPVSDAIEMAFDFAHKGKSDPEHRTLNSPGFFENVTDPARVEDFDWPVPEDHIDPEECREVVKNAPDDRIKLGVIWSAHFQDTFAAFGMENACIQMMMAPDVVHAVTERIIDFYLRANEIFYEATKGDLDAILIGNDFGGQTGLLVSPDMVRDFAFPGTRKLVNQAKDYGLKVIHHSCGSIYDIIPDLIDIGVDAIHPMQVRANNMEPQRLKDEFGEKVAFVGGVDAQYNLVQEGPEVISHEVQQLKALFPTGLIISPSHEAILPDVDPANIDALFKAVRS
jgi:uroporphyrinogen decarboxylase